MLDSQQMAQHLAIKNNVHNAIRQLKTKHTVFKVFAIILLQLIQIHFTPLKNNKRLLPASHRRIATGFQSPGQGNTLVYFASRTKSPKGREGHGYPHNPVSCLYYTVIKNKVNHPKQKRRREAVFSACLFARFLLYFPCKRQSRAGFLP